MTKRFAPMTECHWRLEDYTGFVLAACRVRDEVDQEFGELLLAAGREDTIEAWSRAGQRARQIGREDWANRLRQLLTGQPDENGR